MFAALFAQFGSGPFSDGPPAIFMVFFVTIFIVVIGSFVFVIGRGIMQWSANNQQPVLTVPAKVAAKRSETSVSSTHAGNHHHHHGSSSSTAYFATFEFASGDRKEFQLSAAEFGLLAEEDAGELTFQGTRYKGFRRTGISPTGPQVSASVPPTAVASENAVAETTLEGESFCPFCGVPVGDDFRFCPKCGKSLPEYTVIS